MAGTAVWPVRTNASFLVKALDHAGFAAGDVDTGLIGRGGEALTAVTPPSADVLGDAAARLVSARAQFGFRLNAPPRRTAHFLLDDRPVEVTLATPAEEDNDAPGDGVFVAEEGRVWKLKPWRQDARTGGGAGSGAILSPMPGRIIAVEVAVDDAVTRGQKLLTLEAMKMEHTLTAPFDGRVAELIAVAGAQVQVDALLARIEKDAG